MNYKIRPEVVKEIKDRVVGLLDRRVEYAKGAFPLTVTEIYNGVMSPEQQTLVRDLQSTGFDQFRSHNTISFYVDREEHAYGARRSAVFHLKLPDYIMQPRAVFLSFRNTKRITPGDMNSPAVSDLYKLMLSNEQKAALGTWTNRMIRETRMQDMVNWAVTHALEAGCETTGHLLALWPNLATYVEDPHWKGRLRNPPRSLRAYANPKLAHQLAKEIPVADAWLHGADILEPWEPPAKAIQPTLVAWEWLPDDRGYD